MGQVEKNNDHQDAVDRIDNRVWKRVPLVEEADDSSHQDDPCHDQQAEDDGVLDHDQRPADPAISGETLRLIGCTRGF